MILAGSPFAEVKALHRVPIRCYSANSISGTAAVC